jgi:GT2 family glycosyltransferase
MQRISDINIAILVPTYFRPVGLRRLLQSLRETAPAVHPVIAAEPDDRKAPSIAREFNATFVMCQSRRGAMAAWNLALATAPSYDAYILGADDCYYLPGWYEEMINALNEHGGSGLFALNDGTATSHFLMTRDFIIEHNGGVMAIPHYRGWYLDWEACERAKRVGKYFFVEEAKIVHDRQGSASKTHADQSLALYKQRLAANFPNDFPSIINA